MTVLKALWDAGPCTVRELMATLEGDAASWADTTVQTLLLRLCDKGFAAVDKRASAHCFAAKVTREQMAGDRVQDVVDDVLDGALAPLLLGLLPKGRFSKDEIERFRQLLDDHEEGADDRTGDGKRASRDANRRQS